MSTTLIVLAKAPVAGQVKTRLIPALGADGAAALAHRLLEHTLQTAAAAGFDRLELCTAPDAAHPLCVRLARAHGAVLTAQGDGDLGARMQRALGRALAGSSVHADGTMTGGAVPGGAQPPADGAAREPVRRALLIGTDAPALDVATLHRAAAALRDHDAVFVPAFDGGYALVGLSREAPALFEAMRWSTPSVMADTRERARAAGLSWAELAPVPDIDDPADLHHLPAGWVHVAG